MFPVEECERDTARMQLHVREDDMVAQSNNQLQRRKRREPSERLRGCRGWMKLVTQPMVVTKEVRLMPDRNTRHPAEHRELIQEFAAADRNNDGRIDFGEFRLLLEGLDAAMSPEEMQIGFGEVDTDRDGLIDCREFVEWWSSD